MKIIIKYKNLEISQALQKFIEEKVNSLEKFVKESSRKKYGVSAFVEIGKETLHHKKGPFFRAEVEIKMEGKTLRAESYSKDLRTAVNEVKDELQREIKKEKEKSLSIIKRKSRVLKKETRLSSQLKPLPKGRVLEEGN